MTAALAEITFDAGLSLLYPPHRVVKQAVLVSVPAGVETTINAEWGEPQKFVGSWYAIYVGGKINYGSAKQEFEETHDTTYEVENGFFKCSPIEAYRYSGPRGRVVTRLSSGVAETMNEVNDGDWMVKWPHGEIGVMADEKFRRLYQV